MNAARMKRRIAQAHQATCSHVKGMHGATLNHLTDFSTCEVKAPDMLPALVFGFAKQSAAIVTPHQRGLRFSIPFVTEGLPNRRPLRAACYARQLHAGQAIGLRVADLLMRCQEGQLLTVCAVSWC